MQRKQVRMRTALAGAFWKILSNAMDAVEKRGAYVIKVTFELDDIPDEHGNKKRTSRITVEGDGHGFPLRYFHSGQPALEAMLTNWHASDNFKLCVEQETCVRANKGRAISGTNGVGIKLVNKYAQRLELVTDKGSTLYEQVFKHGVKSGEPTWKSSSGSTGTKVVFTPCDTFAGGLDDGHDTYRVLLTRLCEKG